MGSISSEELRLIGLAVASVRDRLGPEERWDLRQELAIKLIEHKPTGNVGAWLYTCARNWTSNFLRDQSAERRMLAEYRESAAVPGRRSPENWFPTWYPPHPDAVEQAPFSCHGARLMHVQAGQKGKKDT